MGLKNQKFKLRKNKYRHTEEKRIMRNYVSCFIQHVIGQSRSTQVQRNIYTFLFGTPEGENHLKIKT
jgi:hypothetical protein